MKLCTVRTPTYTHVHVHVHVHMYMYIHTCTCTYTHTVQTCTHTKQANLISKKRCHMSKQLKTEIKCNRLSSYSKFQKKNFEQRVCFV